MSQAHPEEVRQIVRKAKSFRALYLSQQECCAVQLLDEYSKLLLFDWKLQEMAVST